jgi:predicted metal-dependent enzyme (double-stranded beta helix superfamily)
VIAMSWGPGQGTPLHDHDAMWCVEGVWLGELEITRYELLSAPASAGVSTATPRCAEAAAVPAA